MRIHLHHRELSRIIKTSKVIFIKHFSENIQINFLINNNFISPLLTVIKEIFIVGQMSNEDDM